MRKIIVPTLLGVTLLATGCASHGHDDAQGTGYHGDDKHSSMMKDHHGDDQHGSMMKGHQAANSDGHGAGHGMGHGESLAGNPGNENEVGRVINVEANDSMRFIHEPFDIKDGETIKFVVTNKGAVPHEFSIGTKGEHMGHGQMMMANPDMQHGPGGASITIAPGKTETLIWYFEEAWQVEAACNIPGHYQAGMHSPVKFVK